jgi:2-acylglycerol O-acyltransferase 2
MLACPIIGLQLRWWGVGPVDGHHLKNFLETGKPVGLLPGGFEEATLTTPTEYRIFIKSRKGFIKYALEHNYTVYPVLEFNEHKAFHTLDRFPSLRLLLNRLKIPSVLFFSPSSWCFIPTNLEIYSVVGRGIKGRHFEED